jgi:cytochrome c oxidase subunit I
MSEAALLPAESRSTALDSLSTIDHKQIGILYMLLALFFFLIGGVKAMLMRAQLGLPNLKFLSPEAHDQTFAMHGTTMIFLVVTPVLIGFSIYLVPLMIGARDMAFPRLNALGFWLQLAGGLRGHQPIAVEAVSLYWQLVDPDWIAIFSVVYLGALV